MNVTESDHEIKMSKRTFSKAMIGFGAATVGFPSYNLTNTTDQILKHDGKLIIHPLIFDFKFEIENKYKMPFNRMLGIKLWGCNWDCRWCPTKFYPPEDWVPIRESVDQITDRLLNLDHDARTIFAITGGEPLLQKKAVLKWIESLKTKTNYTVMLVTNGSLMEEDFIDRANDLGLDGIITSFYSLDDKWHKWYTGHSNKNTINALKMVTEKFEGLAGVSLVLFDHIDMAAFKNTCVFLYEINPNFLVKLLCPYHEKMKENCMKSKRHEAEDIVLRYFSRMDRNSYFSEQIEYIKYQIEGGTGGRVVKSREWSRTKKVGDF